MKLERKARWGFVLKDQLLNLVHLRIIANDIEVLLLLLLLLFMIIVIVVLCIPGTVTFAEYCKVTV